MGMTDAYIKQEQDNRFSFYRRIINEVQIKKNIFRRKAMS
jgi:hypothetical protein